MGKRMCACSRFLPDGAYICETCADELGSLALRCASMWSDLQALMLGRRGACGGRSATRVHADINLDEEVSAVRMLIERTLSEMVAQGSVVERACFVARNRYAEATMIYAPQRLRKFREAVQRAGELLEPNKGRWLDQQCPKCTGSLGVVLKGSNSVVVCSQRPDHCFSIRDWVTFL